MKSPRSIKGILDGDKAAQARFNGHGTALAQSYHHSILPLCNERDKRTELAWGLADFERRFGRRAEGLWLPEAAVDTATLEAVAETNIKFVLTGPPTGLESKILTAIGIMLKDAVIFQIDPLRSCFHPEKSFRFLCMTVTFLMEWLSPATFTMGIFANKVCDRALETDFVSIATDGESYGHHHRYGEMALARAIEVWEGHTELEMTIYGEVSAAHVPDWELEIVENSSWSCAHGIGRWKENCGCRGGRGEDWWTQGWRAISVKPWSFYVMNSLKLYERDASKLLRDVWAARDDFGHVVSTLDAGERDRALTKWWEKHGASSDKRAFAKVCELLEVQRHGLAMFTSCAWFFDDLAGIETVQVLRHADRAIQLAEKVHRARLRTKVSRRLSDAVSNEPVARTGAEILEDIAAERLAHVPAAPDRSRDT